MNEWNWVFETEELTLHEFFVRDVSEDEVLGVQSDVEIGPANRDLDEGGYQ